jgi:outer membrane protein
MVLIISTLDVNKFSQRLDGEMHLIRAEEMRHMLRITTERKRGKVTLSVEGKLVGGSVGTLEQCWRELRSASPEESFRIDLCGVSFIDGPGKVLLKEIYRQGGRLLAEGCLNQSIIKSIVEEEKAGVKNEERDKKAGSKRSHIVFYGALLSLLVSAASVHAQAAPPTSAGSTDVSQPLKLTLDHAVSIALKQNPTAQIAVLQAAQAEQDKNIARADLLPRADLQVYDAARRSNIEAQLGVKIPGFPQHVGPIQIFNAGPTFGMPLFDLTLWRRYQAQRFTANAERANSLSTREQVILLVVSQYIGALRAEANVVASQSRVDLAQALFDQAGDLQKQGVGTGIDTLRANVELQNEKQRLLQAKDDRETALYALSRLLNLDPRQPVELADSLSFFETPQPDVQESIDAALAGRHEWKSLDQQIQAAERSKKAAQDSRLPSLRFDGDWAYQGTSTNNGIPVYSYQASLNMPLFTGGKIRAEVVKADLQIRKLEEQRADLRNQIALDVKTALLNLESARSEVEVANLGVELAKQEVEQSRDRFKAGVTNNIEVIQSQDALSRANDNQIGALYRFNQARADYARATGQMEKIYAK